MSASFVTDAMIYLAAAVICVPLAARFGLGSVLGYLIAGCAAWCATSRAFCTSPSSAWC